MKSKARPILLAMSMMTANTVAWTDCLKDPECRREICYMFSDVCGPNGECKKALDEEPYFRCECNDGYTNLTPTKCVSDHFHLDRIGCMVSDDCVDAHASCQLQGGGVYQCVCNEGYIGNGKICEVNDNIEGAEIECPEGADLCTGPGTKCIMGNTDDTAHCVCEDDLQQSVPPTFDCTEF